MQEGKSSRSRRHRRKQRLTYSCLSPYAVNSFSSNNRIETLAFSVFLVRSSG